MSCKNIAIVTDSTCDVSPEELESWGVRCINLTISDAEGNPLVSDNEPESVERFFDHLDTCKELPRTSMPSPLEFGELYAELAREGYDGILSLHITKAMSGTVDAARMAAQTSSVPVEVVDTSRNTWALALLVRMAARLRDKGEDLPELAQHVLEIAPYTDITFALDKLDNLVKGGRAGKALGLAASLLDIKPILTVGDDGIVTTLAKTKSMKRAINRLAMIALELTQTIGPLEGFLVHVRNEPAVSALREAFKEKNVPFKELGVRQVGPVIATHVGTGCVGFAYIPARP